MRKPILAALLLPLAAHAGDDVSAKVITPFELSYRADPQIPGVGIAVVAGDPGAAAPYTLRVRFAAGASAAPHAHPDERVVTVLEGEYRFAAGTKFDAGALHGYGPGTVLVVPAGMPHFSVAGPWGAVVQESGYGPTAMQAIQP